jgi:hypothetical protein
VALVGALIGATAPVAGLTVTGGMADFHGEWNYSIAAVS